MKRIDLKKKVVAFLGVGMMLALAPMTMAQEGQESPNANELGNIDTSQQMTTTTTTTNTTTGSGDYQVIVDDNDTAPLPNTGGEPLLFVLAGGMLIGGGWVMRRKMVQTES